MGVFAFLVNIVLHIVPGLSWVLSRWQIDDSLPKGGVDAFALISYAAHRDGLTRGSGVTMRRAYWYLIRRALPGIVGFGVFKGPTATVEQERKENFFSAKRYHFVGAVTSSTDECEAILSAWKQAGENPASICVIAEGAHSRRGRAVWKHILPNYFPSAKLYFKSVDARLCSDHRNPMHLQRYWRVWLVFNVVFYPLYTMWPGVGWFAKKNFHQSAG